MLNVPATQLQRKIALKIVKNYFSSIKNLIKKKGTVLVPLSPLKITENTVMITSSKPFSL
jgi:hypothetical protein